LSLTTAFSWVLLLEPSTNKALPFKKAVPAGTAFFCNLFTECI
jgi:hypothetical protein